MSVSKIQKIAENQVWSSVLQKKSHDMFLWNKPQDDNKDK